MSPTPFEVAIDYELDKQNEDVDEDAIQFTIPDLPPRHLPDDGWQQTYTTCTAYMPTEAQFAYLLGETGRHTKMNTQIAGVIDFFNSILDADSSAYIAGRLLDRQDPFGVDQVQQILTSLAEQWTGNPTGSRSGSTGSPKRSGQSSKRRTPVSTS